MADPYGSLKKSPLSLLLFVLPAVAIVGISGALALMEAETMSAAFGSPAVLVACGLAVLIVIWGGVYMSRPIVTLTKDGVEWPGGRTLLWSQIDRIDAGQEVTVAPTQNTGTRQTTHEVTRLFHGDEDMTKITTTLAADGPQAANARIAEAYARSQTSQ